MKKIITLFFLFITPLFSAGIIHILDIWNNQPVSYASVILNGDTLSGDVQGLFYLPDTTPDNAELLITANGYHQKQIITDYFRNQSVFLVPIESTEEIIVTGIKNANDYLALPGHTTQISADPATGSIAQSAADALNELSGITFKSYGADGQLNSIAIRGMSSGQTQILLDGIPLNNIQLSSFDLNQYALADFRDIQIYRAGNLFFGGSGAIGGSVNFHLRQPDLLFGYQLDYHNASFGNKSLRASLDLPIGTFTQKLQVNRSFGENNYSTNFEDKNIPLQNRDFDRLHIQYQNRYPVSTHFYLDSYFSNWSGERGAPKPFINVATELNNLARISEDNSLTKMRLSYKNANVRASIQGYAKNDWMEYTDESTILNNQILHSVHHAKEQGFQLRGQYLAGHQFLISSGFASTRQHLNSTDAGIRERTRNAFYLISDYEIPISKNKINTIHLSPALRIEITDNQKPVVLPAFGITGNLPLIQVHFSTNKNFRVPSMNDLYWVPGGNPDLDPENALNLETGFKHSYTHRNVIWMIQATVYHNLVENQIKWLQEGGYLQPQNISEIFSKGMELEARIGSISRTHAIGVQYTYGTSIKNKADFAGDATTGNQLPFLPREYWQANARTGFANVKAGLQFRYSSFSYNTIQNDSDDFTPSYYVTDLWLSYALEIMNQRMILNFSIKNIFDSQYEVIKGYPMPPRNIRLSLSIRNITGNEYK